MQLQLTWSYAKWLSAKGAKSGVKKKRLFFCPPTDDSLHLTIRRGSWLAEPEGHFQEFCFCNNFDTLLSGQNTHHVISKSLFFLQVLAASVLLQWKIETLFHDPKKHKAKKPNTVRCVATLFARLALIMICLARVLRWFSVWHDVQPWTAAEMWKSCDLTMFEQRDSLISLKPRCRKSAVEKAFLFCWHVGGSIVQISFTDLSEKLRRC